MSVLVGGLIWLGIQYIMVDVLVDVLYDLYGSANFAKRPGRLTVSLYTRPPQIDPCEGPLKRLLSPSPKIRVPY